MARRELQLRARLGLPQGLIERTHKNTVILSESPRRRVEGPASPKRSKNRVVSRREAQKIAPDAVLRTKRRTQSGESVPIVRKPRRDGGNAPAKSTRSVRP
jgi:hypothetical protein